MEKKSTHYSISSVLHPEKDVKKVSHPNHASDPGVAVVSTILNYSKALKVIMSRGMGPVEVVLN